MPGTRHIPRILWLLLASQLTGCAYFYTFKDQYAGTSRMLITGNYKQAYHQIEAAKNTKYKYKDRVLFYLDAGMLLHYAGDWQKSNEYLSEAERGIEELYTRSISQAATSFLLNDNALAYGGEDYEDIYLNIFKALNYLHLNEFDEAFVEIRRADDKLKALENKYGELTDALNGAPDAKVEIKQGTSRFRDSALDRWMSMLMYRNERRLDEARIDQRKIKALWRKQAKLYPFKKPDLSKTLAPPAYGKTKLNLLCFSGQGLEKKAASIYLHSEENHLLIGTTREHENLREHPSLLQPIYWEGINPDLHFKLQYPVLETRGTEVHSIQVNVNGKAHARLERIEDLGRIAKESWKARLPIILLKTLTRATLKSLATEQAKEQIKNEMGDNGNSYMMGLLMDVASSATENADLRVSRFFPSDAFIGEVEVPPGKHAVRVEYRDAAGRILFTDLKEVDVQPKRLNLVESFYLN
ncbi:COG3014 family protein [Verrucomicrobiota bacterium]